MTGTGFTDAELAEMSAAAHVRTIGNDDRRALALIGKRVGSLWVASVEPRSRDGRLIFDVRHLDAGGSTPMLSRQVVALRDRGEFNGLPIAPVGTGNEVSAGRS